MSNVLNPSPHPHHTNLRFLNYTTYSSTSSTPSLFVTATHGNYTNGTLLPMCPPPPDEIAFTKMIIIVVCFLSLFVGMSGNLIIVIVRIFKQVQRRNTTAYTFLIGQLAIADFVFAFTICFDINSYLNNGLWTFNVSSCRFIKLIQSASLTTTVGFLTIMAYERYCGISRPLKHHWSIKRTTIITLALWAYIVLTFVPMVTALDIDECGYCSEFGHPSEAFRKGYTMFLFSTNYVAPLISIIVFHTLIVYRMKKHLKAMQSKRHRSTASSPNTSKKHSTKFDATLKDRKVSTMSAISIADDSVCGRHGDSNCWVVLYRLLCEKFENKNNNNENNKTNSNNNSNNGTPQFSAHSTRNRSNVFKRLVTRSKTNEDKKLVKMLVAVTMSFALMTLPTQIYYIWYDFRLEQERLSDEVLKVVEVFSSLVYLHCCMNCVIYSAMDKKFRADVGKTFRFLFNCQQKKKPTSRSTFQRVTMVSRLSRLSRHSLSTTATTTTTSISTSKRSDDVFLKKKKQLSVIEDENSVLKNTMIVVDDVNKNEVFLYEKETVIM